MFFLKKNTHKCSTTILVLQCASFSTVFGFGILCWVTSKMFYCRSLGSIDCNFFFTTPNNACFYMNVWLSELLSSTLKLIVLPFTKKWDYITGLRVFYLFWSRRWLLQARLQYKYFCLVYSFGKLSKSMSTLQNSWGRGTNIQCSSHLLLTVVSMIHFSWSAPSLLKQHFATFELLLYLPENLRKISSHKINT